MKDKKEVSAISLLLLLGGVKNNGKYVNFTH